MCKGVTGDSLWCVLGSFDGGATVGRAATTEAGPDPSLCCGIGGRVPRYSEPGKRAGVSGAPTEISVAEATRPTGDLALLTAASGDPGVDLEEMLGALADQLAAAWPAAVGLALTVVLDGVAVTLTAGDRDLLITANAVLTVPLCTPEDNDVANRVVFYAAPVCDFADLVAVVTRSGGRDRSSAHGHTCPRLGVSGLAEFSARNEAIGVLTGQGHTPDEARIEIQRRATRNARTVPETAQDILGNLPQRGVLPGSTGCCPTVLVANPSAPGPRTAQ